MLARLNERGCDVPGKEMKRGVRCGNVEE